MTSTVPLACSCGKIRGVIDPASPSLGRRVVCMCADCQTYARWLGRQEEILDEVGGTDIYQTTPARVHVHEGREHIRCVRLSPKGLYRFYAGCCRTPLANQAAAARMAFVGVPHPFMNHRSASVSRDEAIGPVRNWIQAKDATGPAPQGSHHEIEALTLLGMVASVLWDSVKREHIPNAFRNDDGTPTTAPEVLSKDERNRLRAECGPLPSRLTQP